MALSNYERVGKTMELLRQGLLPFVERELQAQHGKYLVTKATAGWRNELTWADDETPHLDIAALLKLMWDLVAGAIFREAMRARARSPSRCRHCTLGRRLR
ncbi:MAG: hypothetical protein HGA45_01340 [Chloroflexales bacterium]|nr:hypothetical protein [Chloroflexales bacterium]